MKTKTQKTTWYSSHNFSLNLNPVYSHALPSLIMGQKAFSQVNRVLGIIPVCVCVCEGRITWPFLHWSHTSTYYFALVASSGRRMLWKMTSSIKCAEQKFCWSWDCLAQFHIPGLHLRRNSLILETFPVSVPHYEAMIFRGLCWRKQTIAERILAWGSKDQEQIEARELAWKWSWLMWPVGFWVEQLLLYFWELSWELNGRWGGSWAFVLHSLTPSPSSTPGTGLEPSQGSEMVQALIGDGETLGRGSECTCFSKLLWWWPWVVNWNFDSSLWIPISPIALPSDICIAVKDTHFFFHMLLLSPLLSHPFFFFAHYSLVAQLVKNPPPMRETWVWSLGSEDPLEKGKATHSSILAWRIP